MYEALLRFADNLRKYVAYLEKKNHEMQEHHEKRSCVSQVDDRQFLPGKMGIAPGPAARLRTLHLALQCTEDYNPIFLNDLVPCDPWKKYEYLKDLIVPVACAVYT